jgi:asparagine synthase (glutamine-hydrolysing)
MCGIIGFFSTAQEYPLDALKLMTSLLSHRGPDGAGVWVDRRIGLGLGHARLAIVDLSPLGHQPMTSRSVRFVISFNGEIFNFKEISAVLTEQGHSFNGASDTEVMLAAFEEWGVAAAIERFVGMFAFAVWDIKNQTLTIARDRFGIKPLYYGWLPGAGLAFASDLHALRAHPNWDGTVNRVALTKMVRLSYVPTPDSIYSGMYKLPPGSLLTLSLDQIRNRPTSFSPCADCNSGTSPISYWSFLSAVQRGRSNPFQGSFNEAVDALGVQLDRSVALRMVADVSVGAFLSGGVDSSVVVASMQRLSNRPVRTFCIGSDDQNLDESTFARAVANHLGTEHTELRLSSQDILNAIPLMPRMFDEPFADSSQIPTYLVSQLARTQVTVSLSGDAGDELFGGYTRFQFFSSFWKRTGRLPLPLRRLATQLGLSTSQLLSCIGAHRTSSRIERAAGLLKWDTLESLYEYSLSYWTESGEPVLGVAQGGAFPSDMASSFQDPTSYMTFIDTMTYLPDDILVKVDRASMAVALEARVPLLDHRLAEFACTLPTSYKLDGNGNGKKVLKSLLYRSVPQALIDRPKRGFTVPLAAWLRTTLREWGEGLLDSRTLQTEGIFDAAVVTKAWREHQAGHRNRDTALWNVLMARAWLEGIRTPPTTIRPPAEVRIEILG